MSHYLQRGVRWMGALAASGVMATGAWGQDDGPISSAEEGSALEDIVNPQTLPGREKGPRSVPEAPEEAEAPEGAERSWFGGRAWWNWDRATGDWGGVRTDLEEAGLTLGASYTWEWSSVYRGGVRRGASTRSFFDVNLTLDLEPRLGIEGGSLFADYYSTDDGHPGGSLDAGDFQGFSGLETPDNLDQLGEAWYQQTLFDNRLRLKVGKIDAGAEFGFPLASGEFLNSSASLSPTVFTLPSSPDPAMGVVAFVYPTERTYIGGGLFDGAAAADGVHTGARGPETFFSDDLSDDWFWIGECGVSWDAFGSEKSGRVAAGLWYHTGEFPTFDGGSQSGASGGYAILEQRFWSADPEDAENARGLSAFAQFGWADDQVSEAAGHYGAGVVLTGITDSRRDDAVGVYVSTVDLTDAAGFSENETAFEVFYKVQVTPFFSIKPDIQYIINPGGNPELDNALVGLLQFRLDF